MPSVRYVTFWTYAGRGGPEPTTLNKSTIPPHFHPISSPRYAEVEMPKCPACNGLGISHVGLPPASVEDIVEGRINMTCRLCDGRKRIPRITFHSIIRDLAALSLTTD